MQLRDGGRRRRNRRNLCSVWEVLGGEWSKLRPPRVRVDPVLSWHSIGWLSPISSLVWRLSHTTAPDLAGFKAGPPAILPPSFSFLHPTEFNSSGVKLGHRKKKTSRWRLGFTYPSGSFGKTFILFEYSRSNKPS